MALWLEEILARPTKGDGTGFTSLRTTVGRGVIQRCVRAPPSKALAYVPPLMGLEWMSECPP